MVKRASVVSNKIWRTIVVAGAMLGTPLIVGCGGGDKKASTLPETGGTAAAADQAAADQAAADRAAADQAATDQAAAAQAEADAHAAAEAQAAADQEAADKAAADQATADAAAAKPRPRTVKSRPTGRGFILS